MGTITINVNTEVEKNFRKTAMLKFGKVKGHLGKALTQAMQYWIGKEAASSEMKTLQYLEEGFDMGKLKYRSRSELHER